MSADAYDVAVVGSGFAGTILARALNRSGYRVALIERQRHPRFALGESSTPLANFCLERLARRYRLPDLDDLAAYGRWRSSHPELRRGLKRGFTFYWHRPGRRFSPGERNRNRLLVAASPDDEIADSHWLRSDLDAFLVRRAAAEGVTVHEGFAVTALTAAGDRFGVAGASSGQALTARHVIDATGPRGVVGSLLGAGEVSPAARFRSRLVFGHFAGVGSFASGAPLEPGPYPDERAAVHHLLGEGWMYVLPFDHDCVSAGFLLSEEAAGGAGDSAAESWRRTIDRYPSLAAQFADARPLRPLGLGREVQFRRRRAAAVEVEEGRAWALLPHAFAFFDPMFSTGIAWSLLGVERLAAAFGVAPASAAPGGGLARRLAAYDSLLRREAAQIERLLYAAHLARREPRLFTALSFLYFAAVSYQELRQRLLDEDPVAADPGASRGFLGAGQTRWEALFEEAATRLGECVRGPAADRRRLTADFERWVRGAIAPWNLIGLADPGRRNLYPVDLAELGERHDLLGLSAAEMEARLPRLRGAAAGASAAAARAARRS